MNSIFITAMMILMQGVTLGAEVASTNAQGPLIPEIGPSPWWAGKLLVLIGIMFIAAIVAGFVWHPQAKSELIAVADDHHVGAGHHA